MILPVAGNISQEIKLHIVKAFVVNAVQLTYKEPMLWEVKPAVQLIYSQVAAQLHIAWSLINQLCSMPLH